MAEPLSEKPVDPLLEYVTGYPRLAARMAFRPETAMFRRFDALNMRNLLYLQAELSNMEKDLMEIEQRDKKSGHVNKTRYATNYAFLDYSDNDGDTDQKDLVMEIRAKLREYGELAQSEPIMGQECCYAHDR